MDPGVPRHENGCEYLYRRDARASSGLRAPSQARVVFLLPLLMGGCPEFRDELVSVIETVTRSTLLTTEDTQSIADTATTSLVNATIDLFFDQFRTAN